MQKLGLTTAVVSHWKLEWTPEILPPGVCQSQGPWAGRQRQNFRACSLCSAGRMDTAQWISQISEIAGTLKNAGPESSLWGSPESALAQRYLIILYLFFFTHWDQTGASLPLYHASPVLHPSIFLKYGPVPIKGLAESGFIVSQWSTIATRFRKNILKGYLVSLLRSISWDQQHICMLHQEWKSRKLFSF